MKQTLTHFDSAGRAHMVDIADKAITHRIAVARGTIRMKPETLALVREGTAKKGDVIGIARIAAIRWVIALSAMSTMCARPALSKCVSVCFMGRPVRRGLS